MVTKDGVLIARHDVLLAQVHLAPGGTPNPKRVTEATTDVAEHPEFADRLAVRELDGERVAGWFAEDFTLAEIRTLRARERLPKVRPANTAYTDEPIVTFEEVLALSKRTGVGIYPELKHPTYLAQRGVDVVALFLQHELPSPERIFVQCFEIEPLLRIHAARPELPLVQLLGALVPGHGSFSYPYDIRFHATQGHDLHAIYGEATWRLNHVDWTKLTYGDLVSPAALGWMRETYASGIGPWIGSMDIGNGGAGWLAGARDKKLAFAIHPYTVRPESPYRAARPDGEPITYAEELKLLLELGATGFFVEDVAAARAAVPR